MKLLIVKFLPFSCYFIPLRSKYAPQNPESLSLCFSLNVRDQDSHPYKTSGRIIVFYILTFILPESRREDKILWSEW
jgi:hypothetical protein